MSLGDYIILGLLTAAIVYVVSGLGKKKDKGPSCGGNCAGCTAACASQKDSGDKAE